MTKKQIFLAIHYLEIGGAEISLIGLLNAIDYTQYDVDLFVYSHRGELMKQIPPQVNLLPEIAKYSYIEKSLIETIKKGFIDLALARIIAKIKYNHYKFKHHPKGWAAIQQYVFDEVTPTLPSINNNFYDLAISFLTPHNVVLKKINAKKKIAWIHTDYSYVDINIDKELPVWNKFDHIISISEDVTKAFASKFPTLIEKIALIENILSPAFVRKRANEISFSFPKENNRINLLSIGRITEPKNFDNVPSILKKIRNSGINAYWYIIGFGIDEPLVRKKIKEEKMDEYVILLGKQSNPYPYLKAADIYVQPSRYEGKSVTVREAQMLYKPIIITNYNTARSQVQNGMDGIIVPLENSLCADGIVALIKDKELQEKLSKYLKEHDYGNEKEVNKLYKLIERV